MIAKLNRRQQDALRLFFDVPADYSDTIEVRVEGGQLVVDGAYLHSDGEWATYPEEVRT